MWLETAPVAWAPTSKCRGLRVGHRRASYPQPVDNLLRSWRSKDARNLVMLSGHAWNGRAFAVGNLPWCPSTCPESARKTPKRSNGFEVRSEAIRRAFMANVKQLPGSPDVAFSKERLVVFVDGCFWDRCPRCYIQPSVNTEYWISKADRNRRRDQRVNRALHHAGWSVVPLRECDLERDPKRCRERVRQAFARQKRG